MRLRSRCARCDFACHFATKYLKRPGRMHLVSKAIVVSSLPLMFACAAMTIPVHQTYQHVDEVRLPQTGSVVALDTGETLDLTLILHNEGKRPERLFLHKVEGVFVLIGDGFKNLYVIYPKGDTADVELVPLSATTGVEAPKLRPGVASKCTLLTYKGNGAEKKLFIGSDGKTSPSDCPDTKKESSGT